VVRSRDAAKLAAAKLAAAKLAAAKAAVEAMLAEVRAML